MAVYQGVNTRSEASAQTDTPLGSKTINLKGDSGDACQGLGTLALVVGRAVGRHGATLGSLVNRRSERIVRSGSSLLILALNRRSELLAQRANAGEDRTINRRAGDGLADALLSGLSVCHNESKKSWFLVLVGRFYAENLKCQGNFFTVSLFLMRAAAKPRDAQGAQVFGLASEGEGW